MYARGGPFAVIVPVGVAIYVGLALKSGSIFLPAGREIQRRKHPLAFWTVIGLLVTFVAVFAGLAAMYVLRALGIVGD